MCKLTIRVLPHFFFLLLLLWILRSHIIFSSFPWRSLFSLRAFLAMLPRWLLLPLVVTLGLADDSAFLSAMKNIFFGSDQVGTRCYLKVVPELFFFNRIIS